MGCLDSLGFDKAERDAERAFFKPSPAREPGTPAFDPEEEKRRKKKGAIAGEAQRNLGLLRLAQGGKLGMTGNQILDRGVLS